MAGLGGKRPGAGRKPGGKNSKTAELAREAAAQGITPLDYMLSVLRDEGQDQKSRFDAATAAAPYIHPRLQAVEMSGSLAVSHEAALDSLK